MVNPNPRKLTSQQRAKLTRHEIRDMRNRHAINIELIEREINGDVNGPVIEFDREVAQGLLAKVKHRAWLAGFVVGTLTQVVIAILIKHLGGAL